MLDQITWGQFLAVMTIALVAWYGFVISAFYGREVRQWVSRARQRRATAQGSSSERSEEEAQMQAGKEASELEQVVADLRGILERAGKGAGRQILLEQLSARLASYAGLRRPAFRVAITNFIIKNAAELCGITYSEQELQHRWRLLDQEASG